MRRTALCPKRPEGTRSLALRSMIPWMALFLASAPCALAQTRVVAWGTRLDPQAQTLESRTLAKSLARPESAQWRAKGDQKRAYRFAAANADLPYRVCVPTA